MSEETLEPIETNRSQPNGTRHGRQTVRQGGTPLPVSMANITSSVLWVSAPPPAAFDSERVELSLTMGLLKGVSRLRPRPEEPTQKGTEQRSPDLPHTPVAVPASSPIVGDR